MPLGVRARKRLELKKRNAALVAAFPKSVLCQKCLQFGHLSFDCKAKRKVLVRPSITQITKRKWKADARAIERSIASSRIGNWKRHYSKPACIMDSSSGSGSSSGSSGSSSSSSKSSSDGSESTFHSNDSESESDCCDC